MGDTPIDLDSLTAKQLAKEFKLTGKEIKSKDLSVRQVALKKFEQTRYLLEGGLIVPFVETIVSKKKTIDYTKIALENLLKFLNGNRSSEVTPGVQAVNTILNLTGNLNLLENVASLMFYKEEVKKVKGKPVIVKESEMESSLRSLSLSCLTIIACDIQSDVPSCRHFALIPNIQTYLCAYLDNIPKRNEDPDLQAATLKEGVMVLRLLILVLRYSPNAIVALTENATTCTVLFDFLMDVPEYTLYCVELYSVMAENPKGMLYFTADGKFMQKVLSVANCAAAEIAGPLGSNTDYAARFASFEEKNATAAAGGGGKGAGKDKKEAKKEAPKGKADATPAAGVDAETDGDLTVFTIQPLRKQVCVLKAVCNLLICVATNASEFITLADVPVMVKLFSNVMLSHAVWEAAAHPSVKEPLELNASSLVDTMCMFFSMLSRVSDTSVRTEACNAGALSCLMLVLYESREVCQLPAEEMTTEGTARLNALRRLAEQAILMLTTSPTEIDSAVNKNGTAGGNVYRWASCNGFLTDMSLFAESVDQQSKFPVVLLMELISSEKDVDLANRGVRMLAAVLQSTPDPFAFCSNIFPADVQTVPRISTFIQARATSLLGVEGLKLTSDEYLTKHGDNTALLTPDVFEAIFHALCLTHVIIQNSSEFVNVFATEDRVKLLSQVTYLCGPVGARNSQNEGSIERKVSLFDARHVTWDSVGVLDAALLTITNNNDTKIPAVNQVILRSLLFDVFSDIANADAKYRTYTDELPAPICMPISESTCPCADAAARICKYCTDIAIASIQVTGRFDSANGRIIMTPQAEFEFNLDHEVLQASLRTLSAIATTGIHGIVTALENIANKGLNTAAPVPPASPLDGMSSIASLETYLKAGVGPDCASITVPWKRPEHYDTYFSSGSLVNPEGQVNDEANVGSASEFWPFLVLCGALLSVLHNPFTPSNIVKTALTTVNSFAVLPQFQHYIQPVVVDIFNTVLLSMGGGVVLPSCIGRFGIVEEGGSMEGSELVSYLFNRGSCRETQWVVYATQKAEEAAAAAAALEADPKGAKAKPPEKKKEDKKGAAASATIALHYVPDDPPSEEVDPNHGPHCAHWLKLLNLSFDDIHAMTTGSYPLATCIYSGHKDLASLLISLEVDVNTMVENCTPLMSALVLQEESIVRQLLDNSVADINAIGSGGSNNSCIKYACLSLSPETINSVLKEAFRKVADRSTDVIEVFGSSHLVHLMTAAGVDVNVSDADTGNYPLHCCSGLGQANVKIGGYRLHITNDAYVQGIADSNTRCQTAIRLLQERGADVNKCNADGQTVLHIVSAHSDCATMDYLIHCDAKVNVLDKYGMYPIHYVAIGGESLDAIKAFDLLLEYAVGRDVHAAAYADVRTGQSLDQKFNMDIDSLFDDVFSAVIAPPSIESSRMEAADVLCALSNENLSIIQIAMTANSFHDEPFELFARYGTKTFRMELALHIYKTACIHKVEDLLLSNVDDFGLTTLHSASLLFAGITPQRQLKPIEKTKRNRKFASTELHILEVLENMINNGAIDINASCSRTLKGIEITHSWTALHGCILGDNNEMLARLLNAGANAFQYPYIYFATQFTNMSHMTAKLIVDVCASASSTIANQLLNERHEGITRPIFQAIRHHNNELLRELICCEKCQMNNNDMHSDGRNSIHEVVHNAFLPLPEGADPANGDSFELAMRLLETFEIYGGDRIDLLVPDHNGNTVIDEVIEHRNLEMLKIFVSMRKTDVVEKLITRGNAHRAVVGRLTSGFDSFIVKNSKSSQEPPPPAEATAAGDEAVAAEEAVVPDNGAAIDGEKKEDAKQNDNVVAITLALEGFGLQENDTNPAVVEDEFGESIMMMLEREFIEAAEAAGFHDYDSDLLLQEEAGVAAADRENSTDAESLTRSGSAAVIAPGFVPGASQTMVGMDPNGPPDSEAVEVETMPPKVQRVKGTMTPELAAFEELMKVILGALESVGCRVVAEDAHAHACFYNNIMYTDYCDAQCE